MKPIHLVSITVILASMFLAACSGSTSGAPNAPTHSAIPTPTASVSTVPTPPSAPKTRVVTRTRTRTSTKVVSPPQNYYYGPPDYYGPSYGEYTLTRFAYPGPIHSYSSPTDTSSWVETIPATSVVSVLCMVHGEPLQGADMWDWDGSGWIWDEMVDMNGGNPPPC